MPFGDKIVVFIIDKEYFGIDVMSVGEIMKYTKIMPIPDSEFSMEGVIELRGTIVNVYDFRKKMGYSFKEADNKTRIIIINENDKLVGIIVDEVLAVEEYNPSELKKVSSGSNNKVVKGIISRKDKLISLLDTTRLFEC